MPQDQPNQSPSPKGKPHKIPVGLILGVVNLVGGTSVFVKGIIVAIALVLGYGSVSYFHGDNELADVAEQVVEAETGVHVDFDGGTPKH